MKKLMNISIFVALMLLTFNAYAGYYDYTYENFPGSQAQTNVSSGNSDYKLKMTLWINGTNTITVTMDSDKEITAMFSGWVTRPEHGNTIVLSPLEDTLFFFLSSCFLAICFSKLC